MDNIQFDDDEKCHLCFEFRLSEENNVIRGFRAYKMEEGKKGIAKSLEPLYKAVPTTLFAFQ